MEQNLGASVMFHHFTDLVHPKGQGAITELEFEEILDWLESNFKILSPEEFKLKLSNATIQSNEITLTFDDGLRCQIDIAEKVLQRRGLRAFFFVYTSIFTPNPDPLEIYRHFRTTEYLEIDDFYSNFFDFLEKQDSGMHTTARENFEEAKHLADFSYYSTNDRFFRYMRDRVLTDTQYISIMETMMFNKKYDIQNASKHLWMTPEDIKSLHLNGHAVGMHSQSHPTRMDLLNSELQKKEYETNFAVLHDVLSEKPWAMSHPCGQYNSETLRILREMRIDIGFRSNSLLTSNFSNLELPRIDHADLMKLISAK